MELRPRALEKMVMQPTFWKDKRVFVTGHTGFKGSWLSLLLTRLGATVSGYALPPPTTPSLFEVANAAAGLSSSIGDVRDLGSLTRAVQESKADVVFHLAAQSLVRPSYEAPVDTYATNVMGTVNTLEAVRQCASVKVVVVVTSDKCYENREWLWGYREDEAMGGYDPYSSSKGCAELVTAAYRRSFFQSAGKGARTVAIASARAGNVIGGGDWAKDRLVPDLIGAFAAKRSARIRNPNAIRPWQHVLEPLAGYLALAEKLWHDPEAYAGAWNFGPGEEDVRTVSWIVERLAKNWGEGAAWNVDSGEHPHEAGYLKLDCSKARARLGWTPRLDLEVALEWITEWHRAHLAGGDMHRFSQQQIERYMNRTMT
ncbi:MAG: wcaG1 [Betaproteobacteria bacterium]|nr:wcaG1 [Betaproteobacteria bacterium]